VAPGAARRADPGHGLRAARADPRRSGALRGPRVSRCASAPIRPCGTGASRTTAGCRSCPSP
jgi:hypothetical protein